MSTIIVVDQSTLPEIGTILYPDCVNSLREFISHRYLLVLVAKSDDVQSVKDWRDQHYPDIFTAVHAYNLSPAAVFADTPTPMLLIDTLFARCKSANNLGIPAILFGQDSIDADRPHNTTRVLGWKTIPFEALQILHSL